MYIRGRKNTTENCSAIVINSGIDTVGSYEIFTPSYTTSFSDFYIKATSTRKANLIGLDYNGLIKSGIYSHILGVHIDFSLD